MNQPEWLFLQSFFKALNKASIRYAVMRNYEPLPFSSGGSDLDILITPDQHKTFADILQQVIDNSNAVSLGTSTAPDFFKTFVLGKNAEFPDGWWGVCIDVNVGLYYKGMSQLDHSAPLPEQRHHDIRVLSPGYAGVLGVIKEVLNNQKIPVRYLQAAREAVETDWHTVARCLSPMGEKSLALLKQAILQPPEDAAASCRAIRRAFVNHVLAARPLAFVVGIMRSTANKLLRYIRPSGTVMAILGTDGAGKSTVIEAIKPALDMATHHATVLRHLRPGLLPPLRRLKGKSGQVPGTVTEPHASSPSGTLGSLIRLIYALANYVMGYWFETRLQIAKQPTVVIFDRYAYDLFLDPRRFRIRLPVSFIRRLTRLAPKPDLIICLYGDPAVLAARKRELPVEEVASQVAALQAFAASEPRAVLVNTEGTVGQARDAVLEALIAHARRKQQR